MEIMNWADWTIIAIVVISGLFSIRQGFVKEALSLATWVAAFIIARIFSDALAAVLARYIETPSFRLAAAFAILFIATLFVGALISNLIRTLVQATGLSSTDRILGMGFGLVRGGLIVVALVALLGGTPAVQDAWWQQSQLIPHFALLENWTKETATEIGQIIWQAGR